MNNINKINEEIKENKEKYISILDMINEKCPNGVEFRKLGEVCQFQNGYAFKSNLFVKKGNPIVRITNIDGHNILMDDVKFFSFNDYKADLSSFKVNKNDILIALSGATTGKVGQYKLDKPIYINQRVGKFLPNKNKLDNQYLFHVLLMNKEKLFELASGAGAQPNLSSTKLMNKLEIPVPPLKIQQEIVNILDQFEELEKELEKELKMRIDQYEYYRNMLLSFDDSVEKKKLGEVVEIKTGKCITKKQCNENGKYKIISGGVEPMGKTNIQNRKANTVTIARAGTAGYVNYIKEDFYLNDKCFSVIPNDTSKINSRYLYFYLKNIEQDIFELRSIGGVPTVNINKLSNILISLPSLEVQKSIAETLDQFDELCTSLTNGIPAEISMRKEQYEYYRNLLLNFKSINENEKQKN